MRQMAESDGNTEAFCATAVGLMNIPLLAPFEESDWESVATAFEHAPSLALGQAWREKPEENFRPGTVRIGWQPDALVILAHLQDDALFTAATGDNQLLWSLGDVFEIFLRDLEREEYLELHITPKGHRLQLRFPGSQAIQDLRSGQNTLKDYMIDAPIFDFSIRTVSGGWAIRARVPLASLGIPGERKSGMALLASFGRSDYADEKSPPVLSSTSAHEELNYHRQQEWTRLDLV